MGFPEPCVRWGERAVFVLNTREVAGFVCRTRRAGLGELRRKLQ